MRRPAETNIISEGGTVRMANGIVGIASSPGIRTKRGCKRRGLWSGPSTFMSSTVSA
jgi:hypothetical protein